jgi:hypothetical protein
MTFLNEPVSRVGTIEKQHRVLSQREDIKGFKDWCNENGKKPYTGLVINEYVRLCRSKNQNTIGRKNGK